MRSIVPSLAAVVLGALTTGCASPAHMVAGFAPAPVSVRTPAPLVYEHRPTAAHTIAGRIIDDATGLPLKVSGDVTIDDRTQPATTDSVGHVDVAGVEPGSHVMVTLAPGFAERTDTVLVHDLGGVAIELRLMRLPGAAGLAAMPARVAGYIVPASLNAPRARSAQVASATEVVADYSEPTPTPSSLNAPRTAPRAATTSP